jgi:iron complex outermembrane receptor protein
VSAFLQDELSLANNRLRIQFGSKLEHNDYTGVEIQPSVRAAWEPDPDRTLWGALTRATRTPTRFDSDIQFRPPGLNIQGNPDFKSEEVLTFEAGYRTKPVPRVLIDIAAFYNIYDKLRSLELANLAGDVVLRNNLNVDSWGGELAVSFDMNESVRLTAGYSNFRRALTSEPGTSDIFNGTLEGNDPRHQILIRTSADIGSSFEWDSMLRFVGALPAPQVPRYLELESRFGWAPVSSFDIAIVGRNLLDRQHPEFGNPSPLRPEAERNIYLEATLRFD